jgi:hypothetical protein
MAKMDGMVVSPPRYGMIFTLPSSSTMAAHELVVPRSMPMMLPAADAMGALPYRDQ